MRPYDVRWPLIDRAVSLIILCVCVVALVGLLK
jgi:hypothetical protein